MSNAARFEPTQCARAGAILDELRAQDALTRHGRRQFGDVTRAVRKLEAELGRAPEDTEVAKTLGIDLAAYHKLTENLSRGPALANLGALDPDDVAGAHDSAGEFESRELRRSLCRHQRLRSACDRLGPTTRRVPLAEIANLGVTESRVCQFLRGDRQTTRFAQ